MEDDIVNDKSVRLTRDLVRVPSITPIDAKDLIHSKAVLAIAADACTASGAHVESMRFEGDHPKWSYAVDNSYVEWPAAADVKTHICYIGHLDVVPPGATEAWRGDPYSGDINDGFISGRGVTDMKGSVAAFITAMDELRQNSPDGGMNIKVSMILTTDEEWAAVNGTDKVLKWMKEQGKTPDAFIIGEPTSAMVLGSTIKTGRRGSLSGTFTAKGVQGHTAYQGLFVNPNRALALAISILSAHQWKDGNEHFPNTNFETVALQSGSMGATSIVPGTASALWNIRFTPDQTPENLTQWMRDLLDNPPDWAKSHPDAPHLKNLEITANFNSASYPYFSTPAKLARTVIASIEEVCGLTPEIDGSGGTTDGRFVHGVFPNAEIVEIGLPENGGVSCKHADHGVKGGMHQIDERAAVEDVVKLKRVYKGIIQNFC